MSHGSIWGGKEAWEWAYYYALKPCGEWYADLFWESNFLYNNWWARFIIKWRDGASFKQAFFHDPLVLDLDGDGFELTSRNEGVFFDSDNRGLKEHTAWVSADDGMLAVDLDNNGTIDSGAELFGDATVLPDGTTGHRGFEALSQYDSNGDGVIDARDEMFDRLLVWQDKNQNGISEADELKSLSEMGIESISLDASEENGVNSAAVNYDDGHSNKAGEFCFDANHFVSIEKEEIEISEEIQALANVRSMGNVASLHTLMQLDETGVLKGYVNEFMNADSIAAKEELTKKILYFITGADDVDAKSRGNNFNAKKLTVIEAFTGEDFIGTDSVNPGNPTNSGAPYLEKAYEGIFELYYSLLNAESHLKPYLNLIGIVEGQNGRFKFDTTLFDFFMQICKQDGAYAEQYHDVITDMGRFICSVNCLNKENFIQFAVKYSDDEVLFDKLKAAATSDITFGTDGDDTINGTRYEVLAYDYVHFDDVIYGGKGNDKLNGGQGDDTYVFNLGDGQDEIDNGDRDSWMNDKIVFGEGISPEDIIVKRVGDNLVFENKNTDDKITVKNAFYSTLEDYFIGSVVFDDGTVWNKDAIVQKVRYINGTDESETIEGYDSGYHYIKSEIIDGKDGDDIIKGNTGDDVIIGGKGNDTLYGGEGEDTYVFSLGDGQDIIVNNDSNNWRRDRIVFTKGVNPDDLVLTREDKNLVIRNKTNDDMITIENAFDSYRHYVGTIVFADGTVWGSDTLFEKVRFYEGTDGEDVINGYDNGWNYNTSEVIDGKDGDDVIKGNAGDDVIIGGKGNDTLTGGTGNDTYVFRLGDGQDVIDNYDGKNAVGDKIVFGEGISADDIDVRRSGDNLIFHNKYNDDMITVKDAFYNNSNLRYIGRVEFSDGTVWEKDILKEKSGYINGTDDADKLNGKDYGYNYNKSEVIDGGAGDDKINGNEGDDIIIGGTGNDTLSGGMGADTYVFRAGDGIDTINNSDVVNYKSDKIVFEEGVNPQDIIVARSSGNLVLTNKVTGDVITVSSAISNEYGYYYIPRIEFADGTVWDMDVLKDLSRYIYGNDGDNKITGYTSGYNYDISEVIDGGAGNDTIKGGTGNDVIIGGKGNDTLCGEEGADTYVFNLGDGQDTIENYDYNNWANDKIRFGEGINPEDIFVKREGEDLVLENRTNDDKVTVSRAFSSSSAIYYIGSVEFADGTIWSKEDITDMARYRYGTDGNDRIEGFNYGYHYNKSEVIDGGAGDDYINGGEGSDVLIGSTGNDTLYGGAGADTYVFNLGDGQDAIDNYDESNAIKDKIVFGEGIKAEDILVSRQGSNLVFSNKNNDDSVTVKNAFYDNSSIRYVGIVEFVDGTTWNTDDLKEKTRFIYGNDGNETLKGKDSGYNYNTSEEIYGGAGDDTIYGNAGDDIIVGGTGNDTLYGGSGEDTYIFNLGDGQDTIYNSDSINGNMDKIVFNEGVNPEDIILRRNSYDLVITNKTNSDKITVKNAFSSEGISDFITKIEFADKTVWNEEDIIEKSRYIDGTSGNDTLNGFDSGYHYNKGEVIDGKGGNDTIYGNKGNDYIIGGTGNDTMYGGLGSDTYYFEGNFGTDTISDAYGVNTILFGKGITPDMVHSEASGNDLIISVAHVYESISDPSEFLDGNYSISFGEIGDADSGNKITIKDYFYNDNAMGFSIRYEDYEPDKEFGLYYKPSIVELDDSLGTKHIDGTINGETLRGSENGYKYIIRGFDGNDSLYGNSYADTLVGGNGDDELYGYGGKDTLEGNDGNDRLYGGNGDDKLYGGDGDDGLYGGNGDDTMYGGSGSDTLEGSNGDDKLYGGDGDDKLYGGYGNDVLEGGRGNDILEGGRGADIYKFELGHGQDTIENYDTLSCMSDKIVFGEGINPDDIIVQKSSWNLVIKNKNNSDSITLKSIYYSPENRMIGTIEFADGTKWNLYDILDRARRFEGTDGDDKLQGYDGEENYINSEVFDGKEGNDTIEGNKGNDIIVGGDGNDYLRGGDGNDIYVFEGDFGEDTIIDQSGTSILIFNGNAKPEDIKVSKEGDDLVMTVGETGNKIKILTYFRCRGYYGYSSDRFVCMFIPEGYAIDDYANPFVVRNLNSNEVFDLLSTKDEAKIEPVLPTDETIDEDIELDENLKITDCIKPNVLMWDDNSIQQMLRYINGTDEDDVIKGVDSDDNYIKDEIISGGDGDDKLYGQNGDDILIGGKGNDYLEGGAGKDSYVFNLGDGQDVIDNANTYNHVDDSADEVIYFTEGVNPSDIAVRRDGKNLILENVTNDDMVTIKNAYDGNMVGYVAFADGTVWNREIIKEKVRLVGRIGDELDDTINGIDSGFNYNTSEIMAGGDGNDKLYGNKGDDILTGGKGNDYLEGGNGEDTYVFNLGDGQDTINNYSSEGDESNDVIYFGEGINPEDITVSRSGNNMILKNTTNNDSVTVKDVFYSESHYIGKVKFADGTVWNSDILKDKTRYLKGTDADNTIEAFDSGVKYNFNQVIEGFAGNDNIRGSKKSDVIIGGTGDDTLQGGYGDDYYIFEGDFGKDTIINNYGVTTLIFGKGISSDDIEMRRDGNDLIMSVKDSDNQIKVHGYYRSRSYYGYNDETFKFVFVDSDIPHVDKDSLKEFLDGCDKECFDESFIKEVARRRTGTDGADTLDGNDGLYNYDESEIFDAKDGDDKITANNGDDIIIGGKGNDTLNGGNGKDTYVFNLGDGQDVINNNDSVNSSEDKILFGEGIAPQDIELRRNGNDLILQVKGSDDKITVSGAFANEAKYIGFIEFADGTVWDRKYLYDTLNRKNGTDANDTLNGTDSGFNYNVSEIFNGKDGNDTIHGKIGDDTIYGGAGNDILYGDEGDDKLYGNAGNDTLYGGADDDTYYFESEFGKDTIFDYTGRNKVVFTEGVTASDFKAEKNGNNLVISINNADDTLTIKDWFSGISYSRFEFEMSDGATLTSADMNAIVNGTYGTDEYVDESLKQAQLMADMMSSLAGSAIGGQSASGTASDASNDNNQLWVSQ